MGGDGCFTRGRVPNGKMGIERNEHNIIMCRIRRRTEMVGMYILHRNAMAGQYYSVTAIMCRIENEGERATKSEGNSSNDER